MKTIITLLATFLTMAQAQATSLVEAQEMATYEFAVPSTGGFTTVTAELNNLGYLLVKATPLAEHGSAVQETISAGKLISSRNFASIENMVITLSNAKIIETFSDKICKLLLLPTGAIDTLFVVRDYNYDTQSFEGIMQAVKGPSSCAIAHHIDLEKDYQNDSANKLKSTLKILAFEVIGEKLNGGLSITQ